MNDIRSPIFEVRTIEQAKSVILTPEDTTTDARWEKETPYLASLISKHIGVHPKDRVLDYGCGIGRMSKALIDRFGCSVFGGDPSCSMRPLAASYVNDDRFLSCAPSMLPLLSPCALAISVWALQHIPDLEM